MLKDGKWDAEWHPVQDKDEDGRFIRQTSSFRRWITPNGGPGPEGQEACPAETDRYHLYVAYTCPWASRALAVRNLKNLGGIISLSVVEPVLTAQGWRFGSFPGATGADGEIGATYVHQLYSHADSGFTGRATVPVLWDKRQKTIVNNESADIARILNFSFDAFGDASVNLRPEPLLDEISELNSLLYEALNNGVYKAGFASSQHAYEEAVTTVFTTLDMLDRRLEDGRAFLFGDLLTETDIRLFVTLIRFDAAYVNLFKCNLRRIADYPRLQAYLKRLLAIEAIGETVHMDHIKAGYFSIKALNPFGIVPSGPDLSDLWKDQ
jgi:putative glutathione S-transferase